MSETVNWNILLAVQKSRECILHVAASEGIQITVVNRTLEVTRHDSSGGRRWISTARAVPSTDLKFRAYRVFPADV